MSELVMDGVWYFQKVAKLENQVTKQYECTFRIKMLFLYFEINDIFGDMGLPTSQQRLPFLRDPDVGECDA